MNEKNEAAPANVEKQEKCTISLEEFSRNGQQATENAPVPQQAEDPSARL